MVRNEREEEIIKMAMLGPGRSGIVLPSVSFQFLLSLTGGYFMFYFLFTLGLIIKKSLVLSYPADLLACDVGLLFLMAALEFIHFCCGVKGNLTESEGYLFANLIATGTTIVLAVYFLVWQTYIMWGDVILSSILLVMYALDGALACSILARLASIYS